MPKRYFLNHLMSDTRSLVPVDKSDLRQKIRGIVDQIVSRQGVGRRDLDGGLYVGAGGVSYMLHYLHQKIPG